MADAEQLALIRRNIDEWNAWRKKNPQVRADLSGADLSGADLSGAEDINGADFSGADLREANLKDVDLSGADLSKAYLDGADLRRVELGKADLSGVSLEVANLSVVDLRGADLRGAMLMNTVLSKVQLNWANLAEARLFETIFADTILKDALGLDSCTHDGPSIIDHRTLVRSWPLPEIFLRGCGLPDPLITYLPSLLNDGAIQFYSCFISYSTKDQEFADRLYADLQNKGVRCWFASHHVQAGMKLHEQIDTAIRMHERLLVILSPNSMNSKWVKTEIRNARKRELAEKKRVLFPVRLTQYEALRDWRLFDADEGEDLAVEMREYYIPDFSQWKNHDVYMKEFEKLLRDLRADANAREKPPMSRL